METELLTGKIAIEKGAKLIQQGNIVVFPTETVYGLGANAFDSNAVNKIFIAKGRPNDNPLIVHISSKDQIRDLVSNISEAAQKVIDEFMPGPITVIMEKSQKVPNEVTAGLQTVGIRMPVHPVAQEFIKACNTPIAAPSANTSTKISPTKAIHVYEDMKGKVPLIIEGGDCQVGIESTIIDMSTEHPTILRPGAITEEMLAKVLGSVVTFKGKVIVAKAPGMKYKHYAPNCPMVVADSIESMISEYDKKLNDNAKPILICKSCHKNLILDRRYIDVGNTEDEVLRNIYSALHEGEKLSNYIICEDFGNEGKYASVMNRLNKSSGGIRV